MGNHLYLLRCFGTALFWVLVKRCLSIVLYCHQHSFDRKHTVSCFLSLFFFNSLKAVPLCQSAFPHWFVWSKTGSNLKLDPNLSNCWCLSSTQPSPLVHPVWLTWIRPYPKPTERRDLGSPFERENRPTQDQCCATFCDLTGIKHILPHISPQSHIVLISKLVTVTPIIIC